MRTTRVLALAIAILLSLTAPAHAGGPPYTVTADGATSGDHPFTAHSTNVVVGDGITCNDVTMTGTVHSGVSVNPWASVDDTTWMDCAANGQSVAVTPDHLPPWNLLGTTPATTGTSDVIGGDVRGVQLSIDMLGGSCVVTAAGSADFGFHEQTQTIAIHETAGNITISSASFGCLGMIGTGDPVDLVGDFAITSGGPIYLS